MIAVQSKPITSKQIDPEAAKRCLYPGQMLRTFTLVLITSLLAAATSANADPPCGGWSNRAPATSPGARDSHAMAYDSDRGVTVLFGGWKNSYVDDTWEWNGTNWTQRSPALSPPARYGHAMVYDSVRHVTVLFGGYDEYVSPYYFSDTWEWNGTNWTQRTPPAHPSGRYGHAMAYDSIRGVTVLFGGSDDNGYCGDTWEWNGTNWTQRSPANSPSVRHSHAMVFEIVRGAVMLYGGVSAISFPFPQIVYLSDTWEWNGTNWTQLNPATHPTGRCVHAMAYDISRGVTVLFGGFYNWDGTEYYLNDTWEWNGATWTQRSGVARPSARYSHAMVYDSIRGVTVVFGGYDGSVDVGDTWELYVAPPSWTQRSPANSPSARSEHAMAYDSSRGVTVLFGGGGGSTYLGDTWEWNGTNWTQRSPATSPPVRYLHAMAYDSGRGRTVLFGGSGTGGNLSDTWEWNGTNWAQRLPTTRPSARSGHAMAYDSIRGITVLFGGGSGEESNDTWEWNGTNWTQRSPLTNPQGRAHSAMTYDSMRGVTLLFGGYYYDGSQHVLNDTWEWNGTDWSQRTPMTSPPAREAHAMAYDSARGVSVLFGGDNRSMTFPDTFEWNGTTWKGGIPVPSPEPRSFHAMAYDSARGRTVLFGGTYLLGDDTWEWGIARALDADLNGSSHADGLDVSAFVTALLGSSRAECDLCHADFNDSGVIDLGDISGFIQKLLGL